MAHHLVLYDGECGLCDRAIIYIYQRDKKKLFDFAPLQGTTAQHYTLPSGEELGGSVVLIEGYKSSSPSLFLRGKAIFRILWLLGGINALPGLLFFIPAFLYDWTYRLVARNRFALFPSRCLLPKSEDKERFLP